MVDFHEPLSASITRGGETYYNPAINMDEVCVVQRTTVNMADLIPSLYTSVIKKKVPENNVPAIVFYVNAGLQVYWCFENEDRRELDYDHLTKNPCKKYYTGL